MSLSIVSPLDTHDTSLDELHRSLSLLNQARLLPSMPSDDWRDGLEEERRARLLEDDFVTAERAAVHRRAHAVPREPDHFVTWFESLKANGPGQGDRLFPWLAEHADLTDMRWFLTQEVSGEAGFDDLLALVQVKLPQRAKLEVGRNFWDELGRGRAHGMHGPMLDLVVDELQLPRDGDTVWEARSLANLMVALCVNRRFTYQAIGALGVIELTSPTRVDHVDRGLTRLGIDASARRYFALHATVDVIHARAWIGEVIRPLVEADRVCAPLIAEGALMRLEAGRRCFARYRRQFQLI